MSATKEVAPPLNHVFVDFENVPRLDPSRLGSRTYCFTIFLGAKQTKLDAALVEKLMEHAASVQLIRLTSLGKNALDFTLAYYVGRTVTADPEAYVHIVTKDAGFDPLIEHLRSRHIRAHRYGSVDELPFCNGPKASTTPANSGASAPDDYGKLALEKMRLNAANRPKKKPSLLRALRTWLGKDATDIDAENLLGKLQKGGHVSIDEKGAVTYRV